MGDANTADLKTLENGSNSSSIDNVERKMLLLKVAESEKSHFDDVITGAESDMGCENAWQETENSVTQSLDDLHTKRSIPEEWVDEHPMVQNASVLQMEQQMAPSAPHSYYELMDLNREPVDSTVRMARVPSQYQLDALSEMFIFDVPQHFTMKKPSTTHCQPNPTNIISADQDVTPADWSTPYFVNSEYVSELLM
ncbi:Protein CBG02774 [Caenorhabditis briggsae]|uniref:Uncharacterized protein n=2 Tax=Caenorhabditis briggsae TaxID=6238 RepID=A0AAE9E936_CAEBR|nr:Protein CBG02774 [Caenorhabditis briggsae]ULU06351.1 hypothetical protein L3Y34_018305 [Caenorhabditis briggsae]UMM18303.1 hypothetical protein L5515_014430 [Caenorhabditis briggsae]CAP23804.1 Protein CBG02774 [Caenorhabditis briggsae]